MKSAERIKCFCENGRKADSSWYRGYERTHTGINIDKIIDGLIVEHCSAVNTFETLFEAGMIRVI